MKISIFRPLFIALFHFLSADAFAPSKSALKRCSHCLHMNNNHRARFEKNLEDMMGNDWREFRAQLVAQEADEAKYNSNARMIREPHIEVQHEKEARQEKFGNIFSAIFHNKEVKAVGPVDEQPRSSERSIFDGLNVGGATPDSMIPDSIEDPFVSEAEIPVLLQPKVRVDKHRWAHPLFHIESGCVLIANEKLGGVFHQTVVLIIDHNDGDGSTGIVINR